MKGIVSVLLVDDDEAVRGLARVILEHERWHVVEAGNLKDALSQVQEHGFCPDVAVIDLVLPDGLGTDVARDLRRIYPKTTVVFITGDPGWLRRLNGVEDFVLAKPFSPVQLVTAVRTAIATIKPVVVFVEPERVYRRLILSAVEQVGVAPVLTSSFDEGVRAAREQEAAMLFTSRPVGDDALVALMDLRKSLPDIEIVALDADVSDGRTKWFDRRLLELYSVQEVAETVHQAVKRLTDTKDSFSKRSKVHQHGDG